MLRTALALSCFLSAASGLQINGLAGSSKTLIRSRPVVCADAVEAVGSGLKVPKNVGEAKVGFQAAYGQPVDGVQQGFVNEMIVGCQLAVISPTYYPSRVFSLGFESLCSAFLAGSDKQERIHDALCAGLGFDAAQVKAEADALTAMATGKTEADLLASDDFKAIIGKDKFQYSYPLGAGLLALMTLVGEEPSKEVIERWCKALGLPTSRLTKDWEFFEDASRKLVEVRRMMMADEGPMMTADGPRARPFLSLSDEGGAALRSSGAVRPSSPAISGAADDDGDEGGGQAQGSGEAQGGGGEGGQGGRGGRGEQRLERGWREARLG